MQSSNTHTHTHTHTHSCTTHITPIKYPKTPHIHTYHTTQSYQSSDKLIANIANMRSLAIGAPFAHLLGYLQKGKAGKKFKFDIRPDTTVYLCPKKDRVTVVYALKFFDKVDTAIARIFLQVLYAVLHMYMYKMPRIASTYITHHTYTCNVTYIYLLRA